MAGTSAHDGSWLLDDEPLELWSVVARAAAAAVLSGAICAGLSAAPGGAVCPAADAAAMDLQASNGQDGRADLSLLDEVDQQCWTELAGKRIYFAHQQRGDEVVRGLEDILHGRPSIGLSLRAQATAAAGEDAFARAGFVHGPAGEDGNPERKIDAFLSFLRSQQGASVDIAMLDLSMHDIERATDPEQLVKRLGDAVDALKTERPGLQVFACTVPLASPEKGARERMRRMIGTTGNIPNAVRGRYNELVRARFGRERVVDFAHAESERPDGSHCSVIVGGVRWPARCSEVVAAPASKRDAAEKEPEAQSSQKGSQKSSQQSSQQDSPKGGADAASTGGATRGENTAERSTSEGGDRLRGDGTFTRAGRQALAREMLVALARTCEPKPAAVSATGSD